MVIRPCAIVKAVFTITNTGVRTAILMAQNIVRKELKIMSDIKLQAVESLNRLAQNGVIDYSDYSLIYDGLAEIPSLEEQDHELEELWSQFEDIPMDPVTEYIEDPFLSWPAGTHREVIWKWFDERHRKGVRGLVDANRSPTGSEAATYLLIEVIEREVSVPEQYATFEQAQEAMFQKAAEATGVEVETVREAYFSGEEMECGAVILESSAYCERHGQNFDWMIFASDCGEWREASTPAQ